MSALITGVAGFIGSHLAGRLLDSGADIEKARRHLGYTPRTGLKEGLSKQLGAATGPRAGAGTQ
jgi:nucleoside-diphosphate-sugar epimerase